MELMIGRRIGATCLEKFAQRFAEARVDPRMQYDNFTSNNLLLIILYLYLLQVVHCGLVFDIVETLMNRWTIPLT